MFNLLFTELLIQTNDHSLDCNLHVSDAPKPQRKPRQKRRNRSQGMQVLFINHFWEVVIGTCFFITLNIVVYSKVKKKLNN